MESLTLGMSQEEVSALFAIPGERIHAFLQADRVYDCRAFVTPDTVGTQFLLWRDDALVSAFHYRDAEDYEAQTAMEDENGLPHEKGCASLIEQFPEMEAEDLKAFAERVHCVLPDPPPGAATTAAEMLMWSPVILVSAPMLPVSVAMLPAAHVAADIGDAKRARFFELSLGEAAKDVELRLGTPEEKLGNPGRYEIWIYRKDFAALDSLTLSIGLRADSVEWIRYYYDAGADYRGEGPYTRPSD
jgi:hypothetical protein